MFELKKIGIVKRASALLLDAILLAVLATGFMFVISLICKYNEQEEKARDYYNQWEEFRHEYIPDIAERYGFTYEESEDGEDYTITNNEDGKKSSIDKVINALIKDVSEHYGFKFEVKDNGRRYAITKDGKASSLDEVLDALIADEARDSLIEEALTVYITLPPSEKVNAQYEYVYSLLFMMVSIGVLLSYLILEFIIPLILKNGQTVGKKVFSICLTRPNGVKISNLSLFARTLLGKYAIETMFPILLIFLFLFGGLGILAIILFALITLLNVIMFIVSKNKTPIHDVIAGTVAVDKSTQIIFESEEELAANKAKQRKGFI